MQGLQANFIEAELQLLDDSYEVNTRTLIFRQLIGGIPVYQSRLIFVFSNEGRFINYGGNYLQPDHHKYPDFTHSYKGLLGTPDDRGNIIQQCAPYYYIPDESISSRYYTLMPVFFYTAEDVIEGLILYSKVIREVVLPHVLVKLVNLQTRQFFIQTIQFFEKNRYLCFRSDLCRGQSPINLSISIPGRQYR